MRLRGVVSGPILRVRLARDFDRFRCDGLTVWRLFALYRVLNGEDMLALVVRELVIPATRIEEIVIRLFRVAERRRVLALAPESWKLILPGLHKEQWPV